jgi:hypothetical protein
LVSKDHLLCYRCGGHVQADVLQLRRENMLAVDLDESGNPKSAIPIDAYASAQINEFWDELVDAVVRVEPKAVVSVLQKKNIFIMAEKAYRMGVARDHAEHRKMKESYDKMAMLTGSLIAAVMEVRRVKTLEEAQAAAGQVLEGSELPTVDQINEQRASFAYGQLALTSSYHDATPEKLAELKAMCRKMAGCKDA